MSGWAVIELREVSYRYTSSDLAWVLEDVNLCIKPGEYVLLCGASGSGKSTLCRLLNGLIPHFYGGQLEGRVAVSGLDTREHSIGELFGRVGMIFQNPTVQLFNHSVERELAYGLESLGLPRDEMARRVHESAETVGIAHLLERSPHQLSGGEQQLTAMAAVLALHPQVIVLDEPYASLDPLNVRRVRKVLRRIHQGLRDPPAIVIAEHRLGHVVPDADRMVVLHQGRVAVDGLPRPVFPWDDSAGSPVGDKKARRHAAHPSGVSAMHRKGGCALVAHPGVVADWPSFIGKGLCAIMSLSIRDGFFPAQHPRVHRSARQ